MSFLNFILPIPLFNSLTMSQDIDALLDENDVEFSSSNLAFPQKLFTLLESDDSNTISWIPNGFCFKITDTDKFTSEIMPKYFKRKLSTFKFFS